MACFARADRFVSTLTSALIGILAACSPDLDTPDGGSGAGDAQPGEEKVCGTEDERSYYSPELEGCTVYRGTITLACPVELRDFSLLYALREVEGNLNIRQCFDLVSLRGLERLEQVRALQLTEAPLLEELSPLSSLRIARTSLTVTYMEGLASLRGLHNVESVGDHLLLSHLPRLETLEGLESVRTVGRLTIDYNDSLTSLSGLSGLQVIEGRLRIKFNGRLHQEEIDAFLSRVEVRGEIELQ